MKRQMELWQLIGFASVSLGGTLLHFLYEWLGKPLWIAPFSGVNESTFEHMKLLFWPMLLFGAIQSLICREYRHFWCIKLRGILSGLVLIPVLFYTYNGVIGKSPDWLNIAIFFLCAAAAFLYETWLFRWADLPRARPRLALACVMGIALSFVLFTFFPPPLALFEDPVTHTYGIEK